MQRASASVVDNAAIFTDLSYSSYLCHLIQENYCQHYPTYNQMLLITDGGRSNGSSTTLLIYNKMAMLFEQI